MFSPFTPICLCICTNASSEDVQEVGRCNTEGANFGGSWTSKPKRPAPSEPRFPQRFPPSHLQGAQNRTGSGSRTCWSPVTGIPIATPIAIPIGRAIAIPVSAGENVGAQVNSGRESAPPPICWRYSCFSDDSTEFSRHTHTHSPSLSRGSFPLLTLSNHLSSSPRHLLLPSPPTLHLVTMHPPFPQTFPTGQVLACTSSLGLRSEMELCNLRKGFSVGLGCLFRIFRIFF